MYFKAILVFIIWYSLPYIKLVSHRKIFENLLHNSFSRINYKNICFRLFWLSDWYKKCEIETFNIFSKKTIYIYLSYVQYFKLESISSETGKKIIYFWYSRNLNPYYGIAMATLLSLGMFWSYSWTQNCYFNLQDW